MLRTFPNYIENVVEEQPYSILKKKALQTKRSPSFSAELIRYVFLLMVGNGCNDATEKKYFN